MACRVIDRTRGRIQSIAAVASILAVVIVASLSVSQNVGLMIVGINGDFLLIAAGIAADRTTYHTILRGRHMRLRISHRPGSPQPVIGRDRHRM